MRLRATGAEMLSVFVAGLMVWPLPLIVPPDHVPPLFSVSMPLPASVPPLIVNASADAVALSVAVPAVTDSAPTLTGTPIVAVAPLNVSAPVPAIDPPLNECVPDENERLPGVVTL